MRVLIMVSPFANHLTPMVPLAWALRAAGHEVLVSGQTEIAATARTAGLSVAAIDPVYADSERPRVPRTPKPAATTTVTAHQRQPPWEAFAIRWRERMGQVAPSYLRLATRWRPDLLLADPLEFAAGIVGARLGIPLVQHRWGVDRIGDARWQYARTALAGICAEMGLADGLPDPDLVVDPCPPLLQEPGLSAGHPVRFTPYNGVGDYPDWLRRERRQPRRICVCLGTRTLALDGHDLLNRVVRATSRIPGVDEVLVAVAAGGGGEPMPPLATVRVVESVPLHLVLDRCQAVVHHGGAGTALTATVFGLPQLVVPLAPYLVEHGERLAATGAGVLLADGEQTEEAIAARTAALLAEPSWRAAALRLAGDIAALPPPAALVATLASLA